MRVVIAVVAAFLILPASAQTDHWSARAAMVMYAAQQTGIGHILILGDSRTEEIWGPQTVGGGCKVINAGFGWARAQDMAGYASQIAGSVRPSLTFIDIGGNDVPIGVSPEFTAGINALIDAMQAYGPVVLGPVGPFPVALAGSYPSANRDAINAAIQGIAGARGVYWDWWWVQTLTIGAGPPYTPPVKSGFALSWVTPTTTDPHYSAATIASRMARVEAYRAALGITCP